jgi:Epoxide hydrolase N terminus
VHPSAPSTPETKPARPFRISIPDDVLDDLRARLARTRFAAASDSAYWAAGTDPGYLQELVASEIMCTRPDTIAAALTDSPAGLAAWIVDKYRDWSDCGGDLAARWDMDTILTVTTLYWATATIGSSFRKYYNYKLNEPVPRITVPAAVTLSGEPANAGYPRSFSDRLLPTCGTGTPRAGAVISWRMKNLSRSPPSCAPSSGRCASRD